MGLRLIAGAALIAAGITGVIAPTPAAAAGVGDRLDLTAPTASMSALPDYSATPSLTVRYAGSDKDSGVKNYDLRYKVAPWRSDFGDYVQPKTWQARTATTLTFTTTAGSDYCVSVRSRDNNGNVSKWTADTCSAVALDDRSLARAGIWRSTSNLAAYRGTQSESATFRSTLSVAARGKRMALVVTTCPTCGQIGIVLDGQLWRTISTKSAKTVRKTILVQPAGAFVVNTKITLGVAQSRQVIIDGIAVSSR